MRLITVLMGVLIATMANASIVFQSNFDSENVSCWNATETEWRGPCGDFNTIGQWGNMVLSTNQKRSGSYAAKYTAKRNEQRGQAYVQFYPMGNTSGLSEAYFQWWNYWTGEDGTYDHAAQAKQSRFRTFNGGTNPLDIVFQPVDSNADNDNEQIKICDNDGTSAGDDWGCLYVNYEIPNNTWIGFRVHIKLNTLGSSDGTMQFWTSTNGTTWTSRGSKSGINFRGSTDYRLNSFLVGGWYSDGTSVGGEGGSDQNNYRYIDDVIISTDPRNDFGDENSPPSVTITTSSPINITSDSASIAWSVADSDGTISQCRWDIGSVPTVSTGTQDNTSPAATSGYSVGANYVYIGCQDDDDDWGYDSVPVYYEPEASTIFVTVAATDDAATEEGPTTGTFRISSSSAPTSDMTINFTVAGTATSGTDYTSIGTSAVISSGNTYTDITVTPIDDIIGDEPSSESVTITIDDAAAYDVGDPAFAAITIADNDTQPPWGEGDKWGENLSSTHNDVQTDTYINVSQTAPYGSTGELRVYTYPAATAANISILKWDLSAVDTGRDVETATLYIYCNRYDDTETNPYYVSVHKIINNDPVIDEATWDEYSDGNVWTSNDIFNDLSSAESTVAISIFPGTWYAFNVTDMVQDWVTTPSTNYGMALTSDNSGHTQLADEDRIFSGAQHVDPDKRPLLLLVLDNYDSGGSGETGGTGTAKPGGTGSMKVQ